MRLSQSLIEELVKEVAGEDVLPLLRLILGKQNVSEFKIAEKLNITVNQVRNMLYRLNEHSLVSSTRKKDKQKGWYIYYWTFDTFNARQLIIERKQAKIAEMKKMINEEKISGMYACPNKCIRVNAEQALDMEYKCPRCNSLLREEDGHQLVEKTKVFLEKLRLELNEAMAAEEVRMQPKKEKKVPVIKPKQVKKKKSTKKKGKPVKKSKTFKKKIIKKVKKQNPVKKINPSRRKR